MELRECPLCGNKADIHYLEYSLGRKWRAICPECGVSTLHLYERDDVVALWNTRHVSPEVKALVEAAALFASIIPVPPEHMGALEKLIAALAPFAQEAPDD